MQKAYERLTKTYESKQGAYDRSVCLLAFVLVFGVHWQLLQACLPIKYSSFVMHYVYTLSQIMLSKEFVDDSGSSGEEDTSRQSLPPPNASKKTRKQEKTVVGTFITKSEAIQAAQEAMAAEGIPFVLICEDPGGAVDYRSPGFVKNDPNTWVPRSTMPHNVKTWSTIFFRCRCYRHRGKKREVENGIAGLDGQNSQRNWLQRSQIESGRSRGLWKKGTDVRLSVERGCGRNLWVSQRWDPHGQRFGVVDVWFTGQHSDECHTVAKLNSGLDPSLLRWVETMVDIGKDTTEILFWFQSPGVIPSEDLKPPTPPIGFSDHSSWTITEKAVENVIQKTRRGSHLHPDDAKATTMMLKELSSKRLFLFVNGYRYRSSHLGIFFLSFSLVIAEGLPEGKTYGEQMPDGTSVLFWQKQSCKCPEVANGVRVCVRSHGCAPFMAVVQTEAMRTFIKDYPPKAMFLDATCTTNMYRWPLYAIVAMDHFGSAYPIAFLVTSYETWEPIANFLDVIDEASAECFKELKTIFIDKSDTEIKAIKGMYCIEPSQCVPSIAMPVILILVYHDL